MGARTLRAYVEQPLIDKAEIELRQEAIGELNDHVITREELREYLNPIYDLERLITRVTYRTANPRDLIAFKNSISMLPPIKSLLNEFDGALLKNIQNDIDTGGNNQIYQWMASITTDCRTPTKILYMTTPIDPAKYVRKYTIDSGSTSAGVPINTRIFGARSIPKIVSAAPATSPNATVVWIAFCRQSLFWLRNIVQ